MGSPNDGGHLSARYRGLAPTLSVRKPSRLLSPVDAKAPLVATRSSTYDAEDTERFTAIEVSGQVLDGMVSQRPAAMNTYLPSIGMRELQEC